MEFKRDNRSFFNDYVGTVTMQLRSPQVKKQWSFIKYSQKNGITRKLGCSMGGHSDTCTNSHAIYLEKQTKRRGGTFFTIGKRWKDCRQLLFC